MKPYFLSSILVVCVASAAGVALADSPAACDDLSGRSLGLCNAFHASACATDADSLSCNTLRDVWEESGNEGAIPGDETVAAVPCWCDRDGDGYYQFGYTPGEVVPNGECAGSGVPQFCGGSEPFPEACVMGSEEDQVGAGKDCCDLDPNMTCYS